MSDLSAVTPERIAETEKLIRPFIRHTPVMRVNLKDFGAKARSVD